MDRTRSHTDLGHKLDGPSKPCPALVLALDYRHPLQAPARFDLTGVQCVDLGRSSTTAARRALTRGRLAIQLGIADEWMSAEHARLRLGGAGWSVKDLGSRNGTFVNGCALDDKEVDLAPGDVLEVGNSMLVLCHDAMPPEEAPRLDVPSMCGSFADQTVLLHRVAPSGIPILIHGATGTGKEVIARAIHAASGRQGMFVAVNCGALPRSLIETELFGYRKGAFSGADSDRQGLVRAADGGTLFLDELAELAEPSQVALLRVLQEAEVTPIGATSPVPVDLRVITATHQDLAQRVADGSFREDLYARVASVVVTLPPLAQRREDIGLLVAEFLRRHAGERAASVRFDRAAARALFAHDWPRNVRELEACIRAAVALAAGDEITMAALPAALQRDSDPPEEPHAEVDQREEIIGALADLGGNVSAAARSLSLSRAHLHRLMKRYGIDPADYR